MSFLSKKKKNIFFAETKKRWKPQVMRIKFSFVRSTEDLIWQNWRKFCSIRKKRILPIYHKNS